MCCPRGSACLPCARFGGPGPERGLEPRAARVSCEITAPRFVPYRHPGSTGPAFRRPGRLVRPRADRASPELEHESWGVPASRASDRAARRPGRWPKRPGMSICQKSGKRQRRRRVRARFGSADAGFGRGSACGLDTRVRARFGVRARYAGSGAVRRAAGFGRFGVRARSAGSGAVRRAGSIRGFGRGSACGLDTRVRARFGGAGSDTRVRARFGMHGLGSAWHRGPCARVGARLVVCSLGRPRGPGGSRRLGTVRESPAPPDPRRDYPAIWARCSSSWSSAIRMSAATSSSPNVKCHPRRSQAARSRPSSIATVAARIVS